MTTPRRTRLAVQLLATARMIENLADVLPDALETLRARADAVDGYPAGSSGPKVMASSELTPVEAAADARLTASRWIDDLLAGQHLLAVTVSDMLDQAHRALRGQRVEGPKLCDPTGREGAIEWADYTCRDAQAKSTLCERCYQRERRWRAARGLKAREVA